MEMFDILGQTDPRTEALRREIVPLQHALELKHLRFFVAVADLRSFKRAAERLHTSQSVVSKFIGRLEELLGAPLFVRDTRNIEITAVGKQFLEQAKDILARTEKAVLDAHYARLGVTGRLNIGYMDIAMMSGLPSIIAAFRSNFPDISLSLTYSWTDRQKELLVNGELDLGFIYDATPTQGLDMFMLRKLRFVAVIPESHPLARRSSVKVVDLRDDTFVIGAWEAWRLLNEQVYRICESQAFRPQVGHYVQFRDEMFGLIAAGLAVTIYPESAMNGVRQGVAVVPLEDCNVEAVIAVAWNVGNANPSLGRIISYLKSGLGIA